MADIGLAAFAVFFMQSPSFLPRQTALSEEVGRGRSNAHTRLGMTAIPCDNHIRGMLDGAPTDHFDPVFGHIVKDLDRPRLSGADASSRCEVSGGCPFGSDQGS